MKNPLQNKVPAVVERAFDMVEYLLSKKVAIGISELAKYLKIS